MGVGDWLSDFFLMYNYLVCHGQIYLECKRLELA